jgi:uncharacterized protein (UPF0276 family)
LRFPHQADAARGDADAAWFEVHPENYLHNAPALAELRVVRDRRPLSLHAVGLSLGSHAGIDDTHLTALCALTRELQPGLVSDHLSWSTVPGTYLADLLPLPYTEEALGVVVRNVSHVQEALGRQLLVENPSTYLRFADAALTEAQFLGELCRHTGCGALLDINNIFVSASNHQLSPRQQLDEFLHCLPATAIGEIHLAGHALVSDAEGWSLRVDDHGSEVADEVWALYESALAQVGAVPTLIEWDTRIPEFRVLQEQAAVAAACLRRVVHGHAVAG